MKNILQIEKILLEELNIIIKELNQEIYFNFGYPREDNICLEKINNIWYVYYTERGKKVRIKEYETLYGACINVIDRLSETNELYEKYKEIFEQKLRRK